MKLSTRTRYGIRAAVELASNYGQGPMRIKSIAANQEISVKYLEQLIAMLKNGGFVRSIRGSKGGYMLAREPKKVKISEVYKSLEGPLVTVACVAGAGKCDRASDCVTQELWREVQNAVVDILEAVTLADLVERAERHEKKR